MIYFDWGHIQMTSNKYCRVMSSTDITRSNISTYCIYHHRNWGRTSVRCWTNRRHRIPRSNGRAMGCLSWIIWEKWSRYNGTALYTLLGTIARNTEFVRQQHFVQVTISKERQWSALLTICEGNPSITAELPQQMANNAENISITWRVHDIFWLGSHTDDRLQILSSTV